MEDRFIGCLGLAVGLRVCHSSEPSLTTQVAEIVSELIGVELLAVIKNDGTRDVEAGDDVPSNEPSHFSGGYRGYGLSLYPFGEVVDRHKKILTCPVTLGKGTRISIPHVANGRGLTIGVMGVDGTHWMGANFWHLSQVHTSVIASFRKLGQ